MLPGGAPARGRGFRHHLDRPGDAPGGRRVRADDDRTAGLQRDEDLIYSRRRRVRGRDDRGDDAEGFGDLDDFAVLESVDDADRLHRPDELVHLTRAEEVFLNLVFDDPVARLFDGQPCERLGVGRDGLGHGADDRDRSVPARARQEAVGPAWRCAPARAPRRWTQGPCPSGARNPSQPSRWCYPFGQDSFDFCVRTGDDVDRDELADAARGRGAGVRRGLDGADVAAHEDGDVAGPDVFLGDEHDVCGFHHRVGGLDRPDQPARFHHSERFRCQCWAIVSFRHSRSDDRGSGYRQGRGVPRLHSAEIVGDSGESGASSSRCSISSV